MGFIRKRKKEEKEHISKNNLSIGEESQKKKTESLRAGGGN